MKVRTATTGDDVALDAFVRAHRYGTFFHLAAWRTVVARFSGHAVEVFVAEDAAGAVVGMLPLFLVKSPLLGRALVSTPWAVYGGVVTEDEAAARGLVDAARARAEEVDAKYVELRHLEAGSTAELGLPESDLYVTFMKDLPDDPEKCLEMIPRKSRASTRQARDKHGMAFREGHGELDAFYELFVENKRSLGSPVFGRAWFGALAETFGDDLMVASVTHDGAVIAGVVSFVYEGMVMPYYSGARPGTERLGSMNYLYWQVMEAAVRRGLGRYDFGRSRAGTGAASFKKNMGFEPTPLHYQYVLRGDAEIPSVNPSNAKYDLVRKVWSRLPVPVVKWLGPKLMKGLP